MTVPGLSISSTITPALVPTVTFGPTLGLAAKRIDKLGLDIRSFRVPLTTAIKEVIAPSIRHNFEVGGRPTWVPLASGTIYNRAHKGYGPTPVLMRSRSLYRVAGQMNIWDVTRDSAVVRDLPQRVWYGKVQQEGHGEITHKAMRNVTTGRMIDVTDIGTGAIPSRPFLVIQPEDEPKIHRVFDEWLKMRATAAGRTL